MVLEKRVLLTAEPWLQVVRQIIQGWGAGGVSFWNLGCLYYQFIFNPRRVALRHRYLDGQDCWAKTNQRGSFWGFEVAGMKISSFLLSPMSLNLVHEQKRKICDISN